MAFFTDLDLRLKQHPFTQDIVLLEDDSAIKMSIRNIIMTNKKEKRFNQNFGGNIRNYTFENIDPILATSIRDDIQSLVYRYEPRVEKVDVKLFLTADNDITIEIYYNIKKFNKTENVSILLRNIR